MIGVSLIEECLRNGIEVSAIVRPGSEKVNRLQTDSKRLTVIECDISDYQSMPKLINKKADTFYHLAWSLSGKKRDQNLVLNCRCGKG